MPGLMSRIETTFEMGINDMINHADAVVHTDIYALNQDFYEGYQWVAALDDWTCLICANLDNEVFDLLPNMEGKGSKAPEQPIHPNCRCFMVPILEGDTEAAKESRGGYDEWFKRQSEADQLDILGPSRFKKYKDGKELQAFVRGNEIMSLDDLEVSRTTRKILFENREVKYTKEELVAFMEKSNDKLYNELTLEQAQAILAQLSSREDKKRIAEVIKRLENS